LEREGELIEVVDLLVAELEASYPAQHLRQLVDQYGLEAGAA
jgi:hypothetical protein